MGGSNTENETPFSVGDVAGDRIRIGGLFRCCIASIEEYDGPMIAGHTAIPCNYHNTDNKPVARIADDGVWEWVGR